MSAAKRTLYWWRPMSGTVRQQMLDGVHLWGRVEGGVRPPWALRNFGDELAPLIARSCAPEVEVHRTSARRADGFLVGSVLQRAALENRRGAVVLGAGVPGGLDRSFTARIAAGAKKLDIRAVRGPRTVELLGLPPLTPTGDAALALYGNVLRTIGGSRGLVIAHYSADSRRGRAELALLADRLNADWVSTSAPATQVLARVASARWVLSTSLHGVILADIAGVPAGAVTLGDRSKSDFRFEDYADSVGREHRLLRPLRRVNEADISGLGTQVDPIRVRDVGQQLRHLIRSWIEEA